MVVTPTFLPPTMPVAAPTVPFDGALLTQVPPVVPTLASAVVAPLHTSSVPDIAVGNDSIVTTVVLVQPLLVRYVMLLVPALTPATTPEVAPIVATDGLLLVHDKPPGAVQLNVDALPWQMLVLPVIAAPPLLTVIAFVL